MTSWIQVTDEFPPVGKLVIVGRAAERPFVGFIPIPASNCRDAMRWVRVSCGGYRTDDIDAGEVRVTDCWLPVPQHEPECAVLPGGWPA